jgi:wyosine [tRNA(Phe)-imidazoG37] synthetase (radical SAM superfamily)
MPIELLDAIVKKAKRDVGYVAFHLYNWTEPLIHPRIGDAIETVLENGVACHLSTNLNLDKNIAAVANTAPTRIRVSVSAFTQDRYGTTHKGGNIDKLKKNMKQLAALVRQNGNLTELNLLYHRYLGNHEEEAKMRTFTEALGYASSYRKPPYRARLRRSNSCVH